jgi:phosphotransferase system HPr (HPr) family protein
MSAKRAVEEMHWAKWLIANESGIHARPAALLVKCARSFESDIVIECGPRAADAKSILAVLALTAANGTEVMVRAEGPDAAAAVRAIGELLTTAFPEEIGDPVAVPSATPA